MLDGIIYAKTLEGIKMSYRIDDDVLNEIKDRANIVDFIGQYVQLKKTGSGYVGLCPFHNEKTPSFHVREREGYYYCFGCHATGDIFSFMMEHNHMSFVDSVEELAKRYGVQLKEENKLDQAKKKYLEKLYQINREAAFFYMKNLSREKGPLLYLENRGVGREIILKYGLGYAPLRKKDLCEHLLSLGYKLNEIEDCNLVFINQTSGEASDRFKNRIIFPIINSRGRVIGFGGRQFNSDYGPKYLNSRDTPIFHKGKNLYGLNIIQQKKNRDRIILVEGYMDVIALGSQGIYDAVASLGTALTKDQGQLLKKYGQEVFVCYDGDEAGIRATKRAINILFSVGIKAKIICLKDGMDPDDFIRTYGPDAFELEVKRAKDAIEYLIEDLKKNFTLDSAEGKIGFLKEVSKLLRGIQSPVERDIYIDQVARNYQISRESLKMEIESGQSRKSFVEKTPTIQTRPEADIGNNINQRNLMRVLLMDKNLFDDFQKRKIFWSNTGYERAFEDLKGWENLEFPLDIEEAANRWVEKNYLSREEGYFLKNLEINPTMNDQIAEEALRKLKINYLKKRRQELIQDIDDAETDSSRDLSNLIQEFNEINKQILEGDRYESRTNE